MFSRKTVRFLRDLALNNQREWFEQNKQRYEDEVRQPALEYIVAMTPALHGISPHFEATAKKVGGSLMRVYRDTRFSRDKTPYKTNIGIQFRHSRGKDVHAPGFYLHIEPKRVFLGAGIWKPENATLSGVRTLIDEHPAEWRSLKRKLVKKHGFELAGDTLKRPPKGFDKEHPLLEDLKRKDYIATCDLPLSSLYDEDFVELSATRFKQAAPLVGFICNADDLLF